MTSWKERALAAEAALEQIQEEQELTLEKLDEDQEARKILTRAMDEIAHLYSKNGPGRSSSFDIKIIENLASIARAYRMSLPFEALLVQFDPRYAYDNYGSIYGYGGAGSSGTATFATQSIYQPITLNPNSMIHIKP